MPETPNFVHKGMEKGRGTVWTATETNCHSNRSLGWAIGHIFDLEGALVL